MCVKNLYFDQLHVQYPSLEYYTLLYHGPLLALCALYRLSAGTTDELNILENILTSDPSMVISSTNLTHLSLINTVYVSFEGISFWFQSHAYIRN